MENEDIKGFIEKQLTDWELLKNNTLQLQNIQTKYFKINNHSVCIQFNPARIGSTLAKTDKQSIEKRPCFLCAQNQPKEQKRMELTMNLNLCVNPFPIFCGHLTLPHREHTPQQILPYLNEVKDVYKKLPLNYALFYNGPYCGASAPDHFHFQAVLSEYIPIITQYNQLKESAEPIMQIQETSCSQTEGGALYYIKDYICPIFAIESNEKNYQELLDKLFSYLPKDNEEWEPKVNIFLWKTKEDKEIRGLIIPRSKHRPDCFYAEGTEQLIVSPGALDMAGVIITTREEDYLKITGNDVKRIIEKTGISFEEAEKIVHNIKNYHQ